MAATDNPADEQVGRDKEVETAAAITVVLNCEHGGRMGNKTIYVKEEDIPLWESLRSREKRSISEVFSEFLRSSASRVTGYESINLEKINKMDPIKIPYSALNLALVNAVEHLAAAVDKANEKL